MITWIKKINWPKVLLASFIYTIIATVVHQIEAFINLKYYMMPEYFGVWSKIMMPTAGPPPMSFMITSLIFTLVTGVSLCVIYYYLKDILPKNIWKRTFFFADLMMGTSLIFFTLPSYLLFNLPLALIISWFISTFIILFLGSIVMVRIIK